MNGKSSGKSEAEIYLSLFHLGQQELSAEMADTILKFRFSPADVERMHELAVKNQEGSLTRAEEEEMENYCRVGSVVDFLASRARLTLKRHGRKS